MAKKTTANAQINARSETVDEKPSFRDAFKSRRCVISADGFFEWRQGETKSKTATFIHLKNEQAFAFAGIYEESCDANGDMENTFAILTCDANALLKPVHERMPVILTKAGIETWLDVDRYDSQCLKELFVAWPSEAMKYFDVGSFVNSVRNDSIECIQREEKLWDE